MRTTPSPARRASRRGFLTVGAVGGLGLTLGDYLQLQAGRANAASGPFDYAPTADSVIHIFMPGGMAQQESFDPKPYAPLEYRGELGVVRTKTGDVFCELLPKLAAINDRFTVIRSLTHGEAAHERGVHNMFTGYKPSPALVFPSFGSVVSHELGGRHDLPPYICIPNAPNEFAGSGYLSSSYGPFSLGADPATKNFQVRDLAVAKGIEPERFTARKSALEAVNAHFQARQAADNVGAMDAFYQQAFSLISSPQAQAAFDLSAEPDAIKQQYGDNPAGLRMLMARRLVEAGVRFVTLTYGGWDLHTGITAGSRNQLPPFDQALSTLIEDLQQRGLLERTLVLVSTEFGRTPKINADAGRDHWPKTFSVLMAGGGIQQGLIWGASDSTASEVDADPVSHADLATTMYRCLGIDAHRELMAPGDRPIEIVDGGRVIEELLI